MIAGMDNGNIIHVVLNKHCGQSLLKEISCNYREDIRQLVKRFLGLYYPKDVVNGIDIKHELTDSNNKSYSLYGEILLNIIRQLQLTDEDEYLIVLPYLMDSKTKENSDIKKLTDKYIHTSIETEMKKPSLMLD